MESAECDAKVLGAFFLCEVRVLLNILEGIQFKLLIMLLALTCHSGILLLIVFANNYNSGMPMVFQLVFLIGGVESPT